MTFAPISGQLLTVGTYESAQRAPFRAAGHPGLDVHGDGRGCNSLTGRFVVDELTTDASSGDLVAFFARFEQHCEGGTGPALFGVVAYQATTPYRSRTVAPTSIDFGNVAIGASSPLHSVTITNNGPATLTVSASSIVGIDAPDFRIAPGSSCLTGSVAAGHSCTFDVAFEPTLNTGPRSVALRFFDDVAPTGGSGRHITLTGNATGTPTGPPRPGPAFFDSEGEYIGQGLTTIFDDVQLTGYSGSELTFWISSPSGMSFSVSFAAPPGQTLAVGTYEDAQRADFREAGHPGLDIFGDSRGCNQVGGRFIIDALQLDGDGNPLTFSARFEHHCEGGAGPALFGALTYNAPYWARTLSVTTMDFGSVRKGNASAPQQLVVTNNGQAALHMQGASITGAYASQFQLLNTSSCVGLTLSTGDSCTYDVRFVPRSSSGVKNASLTFFDDLAPPGGKGRDIALFGTATPGPSRSLQDSGVSRGIWHCSASCEWPFERISAAASATKDVGASVHAGSQPPNPGRSPGLSRRRGSISVRALPASVRHWWLGF